MMRVEPEAEELLRLAVESLQENILPALGGGERYEALLVINAIETALREFSLGSAHDAANEADLARLVDAPEGERCKQLVTSIRAGSFDKSEQALRFIEVMSVLTERALLETNPKALG